MTDHDYYPYGNSSVQTAYVFPRFYGSDLSCFKEQRYSPSQGKFIISSDGENILELFLSDTTVPFVSASN
jgi:hypothetical protein